MQNSELDFCETVEIGLEHIALKNQVGEFAFANDFNQAGCFQFLDVMGESGGAYGMEFVEPAAGGGVLICADLFEDLIAPRLGQGPGNLCEVAIRELAGFGGCHCFLR